MANSVDSLTIKVIGKDDGAISVDSFLDVVKEAVGILRELDASRSLNWNLTGASMQSPLNMTFSAYRRRDTEGPVEPPARRFLETVSSLETGQIPSRISTKILLRASKMVNVLNNGVLRMEFSSPGCDVISPTQHLQAFVGKFLESRRNEYTDDTTIEGDLKTVSVEGGSKFYLFDRLTGEKILCSIPHDKLSKAAELMEKRVWVIGRVWFKNGRAMRIHVDDFDAMPERKDLPQFGDIAGIDLTNGEDSVAFVRRQRDAI